MTAPTTPAQRLLAQLIASEHIESLPIAEVRSDLRALGIDAAPATAFAKALAASRGSPAARLLGAIDEAEDSDEEIARLESAKSSQIRHHWRDREVVGTARRVRRAASAEPPFARRGSGSRRRRVLMWGGSFGGIVASVVVAVMVVQVYSLRQPSQVESRAPAAAAVAPTESEPDLLARSAELRQQKSGEQEAAPTPPWRASTKQRRLAGDSATTSEPARSLLGSDENADLAQDQAATVETASITAILLVNPALAPEPLRSLNWPSGALTGRLEDARRVAGDRPVIALLSLETAVDARDYALVPLPPRSPQQHPPPSPLAPSLGPIAGDFDYLPLPSPR